MSGGKALVRVLALIVLPSVAGFFAFGNASRPIREEDAIKGLLRVRRTDRLPQKVGDSAWAHALPETVHLGLTVPSGRSSPSVDAVTVRVLVAQEDVGFLLEWEDATGDWSPWRPFWATEWGYHPDRTAPQPEPVWRRWGWDVVAIQFPIDALTGELLPSVFLGDPAHPVRLWMWSSGGGPKELMATGPASFQATRPVATERVFGVGGHAEGRWAVILRGKLGAPLSADVPLPFAVYVWDGSSGDAELSANRSAWLGVIEEDRVPLAALARGLSAGLGVLLLEWALLVRLRRPRC